jgi:uncharacterized membrane protein
MPMTGPSQKYPSKADRAGYLTMAKCVAAFALLFLVLSGSPDAGAAEKISKFSSDITIHDDASLLIRETIEVVAEGRDIRRGIFRDLPTTYEDRFGNRIEVIYEVLDVQRDGELEPYRVENISTGIRIRIGQADRFLDTGPHTFRISYRTSRQLGFFDGLDELYWNVTGNGWGFPIESASATIRLPGGARPVQQSAYTGRSGAKGSDYRDAGIDSTWTFETTRILMPGEGLTIAIGWPKGFVTEPSGTDRLRWFVDDNLATGMALISTALIFSYYFFAWRRFGKDPESGTIIPRFEPPDGLSPAAVRFIRLMSFDNKGFSAALINMAVKGYLTIDDESGSYRLVKNHDGDFENLANGERRAAKRLFSKGDIVDLKNHNHELLARCVSSLRESLRVEYEKVYFKRNTGLFLLGLGLSIALIIFSGSTGKDPTLFIRGVIQAMLSGGIVFVILHFWGDEIDPAFGASPLSSIRSKMSATSIVKIGLFSIVIMFNSAIAVSTSLFSNAIQSICFALLGGLNVVFFFLLKTPTLAGRPIIDEIEGFRQYLSVAEEVRLNKLNPPEKTPELFERYLPYALALDVENEWSERFSTLLTLASMNPSGDGYRPRWYRGNSWRSGGGFSRSLGSSLGAAVASSVTPPGSSSGSGGGGFSGGGGGGGGGGGW